MEIRIVGPRLHVMSADPQEISYLQKTWEWSPRKTPPIFNVEDSWVHRLILGMKVERRYPVADFSKEWPFLYEFQQRDVRRLASCGSMLNANPMGLGKTVETLCAMSALNLKTAIVLTKKSCLTQWEKEIHRIFPLARVFIYSATKSRLPRLDECDFIVTNYEKIVNSTLLSEWLRCRLWDMLILDEVQLVKNTKSKRHCAVRNIPSRYVQGLSGTPITRYVDDLYGVLRCICPESVGSSYWTFVKYFCKQRPGFHGMEIVGKTTNPERLRVLNALWEMVAVRNDVEDIGIELPSLVESLVTLDMEPKQADLYHKVKNLIIEELPEDCTVYNGMMQVQRLQQVTSCPKIFEGQSWGPKFEFIADWLTQEPDLKALIVSPYARHVRKLQEYLQSKKLESVTYTGNESTVQRNKALEVFASPSCRALCATIGAIGTGTDGLQKVCNTIIILDRSWGPEELKQSIARLHRIGQSQTVFVYYLECAKSADQRIGKKVMKKLSDIRELLDGDDQGVDVNDYHLF